MSDKSISERGALWTLCFPDDADTAREFFSISGLTTLTEYADGELAAMASLIPVYTDSSLRGFYAYGVCVRPEQRGKGLFRLIMKRCEEYAKDKNFDFICLIPADSSVANAYEKMGYSERVRMSFDKREGDDLIYCSSAEFLRFAMPEDSGGRGKVGFGLIKRFCEGLGQRTAFAAPMGDA